MQFKKIRFPVDYLQSVKWNIIIVVLVLSLILPLTGTLHAIEGSLLKVPLYGYASLYFALSVGSVTAYITGVGVRLESINKVLKIGLKTKASQKLLFIEAFETHKKVEIYGTLAEIYSDLMDVCDEINMCFGFQLMISFGLIFFYTLFMSFSAYTDLISGGRLTPVSISSILFCVYFNIILSSVIFICNTIEVEVIY